MLPFGLNNLVQRAKKTLKRSQNLFSQAKKTDVIHTTSINTYHRTPYRSFNNPQAQIKLLEHVRPDKIVSFPSQSPVTYLKLYDCWPKTGKAPIATHETHSTRQSASSKDGNSYLYPVIKPKKDFLVEPSTSQKSERAQLYVILRGDLTHETYSTRQSVSSKDGNSYLYPVVKPKKEILVEPSTSQNAEKVHLDEVLSSDSNVCVSLCTTEIAGIGSSNVSVDTDFPSITWNLSAHGSDCITFNSTSSNMISMEMDSLDMDDLSYQYISKDSRNRIDETGLSLSAFHSINLTPPPLTPTDLTKSLSIPPLDATYLLDNSEMTLVHDSPHTQQTLEFTANIPTPVSSLGMISDIWAERYDFRSIQSSDGREDILHNIRSVFGSLKQFSNDNSYFIDPSALLNDPVSSASSEQCVPRSGDTYVNSELLTMGFGRCQSNENVNVDMMEDFNGVCGVTYIVKERKQWCLYETYKNINEWKGNENAQEQVRSNLYSSDDSEPKELTAKLTENLHQVMLEDAQLRKDINRLLAEKKRLYKKQEHQRRCFDKYRFGDLDFSSESSKTPSLAEFEELEAQCSKTPSLAEFEELDAQCSKEKIVMSHDIWIKQVRSENQRLLGLKSHYQYENRVLREKLAVDDQFIEDSKNGRRRC